MLRTRHLIGATTLFALTACTEAPTTPSTTDHQAALSVSSNPVNLNEWQTWQISGFVGCANHTFVNGSMKVHLQTQSRTNADGSETITQHLNFAGVTLTDAAGNEFVYRQNETFSQEMQSSGAYEAAAVTRARLISKGSGVNEFVDIFVTISWDNVSLVSTFKATVVCRGGG